MRVRVVVQGCDDQTSIIYEVSEVEYEHIHRLITLVNNTADMHSCQPTMSIKETNEPYTEIPD